MPSIQQIRFQPGRGASTFKTTAPTTSSNNTRPPSSTTPITLSVNTPSSGQSLFASVSQTDTLITLSLRNLVAGENISITTLDDLLVISAPIGNSSQVSTDAASIDSLDEADNLTGSEEVAIFQDPDTVRTTTEAISRVALNQPAVRIGLDAVTEGFSSVAIGYYASATGGTASTAIGSSTIADGTCATAIGYRSEGSGFMSTAIGNFTTANNNYAVAIGYGSFGAGDRSTAIGGNSAARSNATISVGYLADTTPAAAIAMGYKSYVDYGSYCSIAIGSEAGIAIYARSSIAFGYYARVSENSYSSIAIGAFTRVNDRALAIGMYAYADQNSVACGPAAYAHGNASTALGRSANARSHNSIAIGADSDVYQPYSTVIGAGTADKISGSFVINGFPAGMRPADHHQKLVGTTSADIKASVGWGNGDYLARVFFDTAGAIGNNYVFHTVSSGTNTALHTQFDGSNLVVNFATDESGNATTDNTLAAIAGIFPTDGFSFQYTSGFDSSVTTFVFVQDFDGGIDGTPTCVLTSDGNSPADSNLPGLWDGSVATLTEARVVGVGVNVFGSTDDFASFVLEDPILMVRKYDDSYVFTSGPNFVLENQTTGALSWPVPTLGSDESNNLILTVENNINPNINWMAHLTFQSSG